MSPLRVRRLALLAVASHYLDPDRCLTLGPAAVETARRVDDPTALTAAVNAEQSGPIDALTPDRRVTAGNRLLDLAGAGGSAARSAALWGHYWRAAGWFEAGDRAAFDRDLDAYGRLAGELEDATSVWRLFTRAARGAG